MTLDRSGPAKGFMLDTNVFNRLLDGKFELSELPEGAEIYATHVQRDELAATPDSFRERREKLLAIFSGILCERVPTESTVLGVSVLGESKIGGKSISTKSAVYDVSNWDETGFSEESETLYDQILQELEKLESKPDRKESHIRDALIAETAAGNGITLVTADRNLTKVLKRLGISVWPVK